MFVTIFSFVFYFPYIFMFRAKKKNTRNNSPFFKSNTTTLLYCQYSFELSKFSLLFHNYLIIFQQNRRRAASRAFSHLKKVSDQKKKQFQIPLNPTSNFPESSKKKIKLEFFPLTYTHTHTVTPKTHT